MNGAGAYELQEKLGNNSWGTVQQSSATYKSFTDKPVGTYCYRVSAVYVDGSSGWSNEHCTSVLPAMPVLEAIDNADGDGSFSLRWTEVHDDYAYRIYESFNNVGFEEVDITFSNQYEVFDKAVGTWCYRVQAVYESLDSPLSAPRCTTVLEEGPVVPGNKLYLPATLKGAGGDTYLYS